MKRAAALASLLVLGWVASCVSGCTRGPEGTTPDAAVRLFLETMESAETDGQAMQEAFSLLGPRARQNLEARAERASRGQGRRRKAWEMLAEGRFGLAYRPRVGRARIEGNEALVEVRGEAPEEHAEIRCIREGSTWKVEPDLPEPPPPPKRIEGTP